MTSYRPDPFASRLERHGHIDSTNRAMPIPDLRFEKNYVKSLQSYIHIDRAEGQTSTLLEKSQAVSAGNRATGEVIRVDWGRVVWVTMRDQVISPFLQGAVWGIASIYVLPMFTTFRRSFVAWWQRGETYVPGRRTDGDGVGALRNWVSGLTTATSKTTVTQPR